MAWLTNPSPSEEAGVHSFLGRIEPFWTPHEGQREFLLNDSKFKVLACGRRWGKTDACAVQTVSRLFQATPTKHLILAPTVDQASLLFQRVVEILERLVPASEVKTKATPYPILKFGAHSVMARSGHLPRALRGNEATDIVIDEAAFVPESLVSEVAMPMLSTTKGCLTLMSTPHGRNHFYRFFAMGQNGEHGIWSRAGPSHENPLVSASYLDIQKQLISERAFATEYLANFTESAGRVFPSEVVSRCLTNKLMPASDSVLIGVDWARYGDFTAVCVVSGDRERFQIESIHRWNGLGWQAMVSKVAEIIRKYPAASVLCDATGVGDPALELLRSACPHQSIEGFVFTATSKPNLIDNLALLMDGGHLSMLPEPALLRELEHFESRPNHRLEATGGFHDDLVISLALAVWNLMRPYRSEISIVSKPKFSRGHNQKTNVESTF